MSITLVKSTLTLILCCILMAVGFAQSNPVEEHAVILKDTDYTLVFNSEINPNIYSLPSSPYDSVSISAITGTTYELFYQPLAGYTGNDFLILEYFEDVDGNNPPRYLKVHLEVSESIIFLEDDFGLADKNGASIDIDVLANDSASHGPLQLISLALYSNGAAGITDSNTIDFLPNYDFEGEANVKYVVEDAKGKRVAGNLSINVVDTGNFPADDTIFISSTIQSPAVLYLPENGFVVDTLDLPSLGSVEFKSGAVAEFRPHPNKEGLDTFRLVKDGLYSRTVFAQVLLSDPQNGIAKDDAVFTAEATPVSFNVFENDLQNNHPIVAYSSYPGFVHDSLGWFTYTPPSWFSGVRHFSYTIDNGYYQEEALIDITVSDFDPNTGVTYNLKTHKNTPLVINYEIPLDDFDFSIQSNANNGLVEVHNGIDTIYTDCETITGLNMIQYDPNTNYVGSDYFEIEYCPTSNPCVVVKINVEILDFYENPTTCACVYDCVWEGDTDNDGKVSVIDLLPVGYYLGASGAVRNDSISEFTWYGESSADWDQNQMANGKNLKHIDSDGDGIITEYDVDAINAYYSKSHTLTPPQQLDLKDYPFILDFIQDTVYAGDLLQIEIHIGNETYPVKDINGFAFGLSIPSFLIDSASAQMYFEHDGWFTSNSGSLEIFEQPFEGIIESAFTRTVQTPVSGFGKVAQFDFIVEEDLIGVKTGKYVTISPEMLFNMGLSDAGEAITLPFITDEVIVNLEQPDDNPPFDPAQMIVFPNPANGLVNLHLNGGHEIFAFEVYNMMGQNFLNRQGINSNADQFDTLELNAGSYILRVQTSGGVVTQLIEVTK